MPDSPRTLVISPSRPLPDLAGGDPVTQAATWPAAFDALARQPFDLLVADLTEPGVLDALRTMHQAGRVLAHAADGIAVVDFDLRVRWANPAFARWCGRDPVGLGFYEALGSHELLDSEFCPFHSALAGQPTGCTSARLHSRDNRHLDLHITPLTTDPTRPLFVALCHDATALVHKQQKLDALHRAGRELAALDNVSLDALDVTKRVELLKGNIFRLTRDLLHFEVIEIRLLDRATGRLVPLLQAGMTPEAAARELVAQPENNGVTGFVAATGRSYLCGDTSLDSLYLTGATGARSSLTVPLRYGDQIIGTFNVESPLPGAFGDEDLQFAEIFSHALATALHTLELLSAEKLFGASQSIEAVNREVALPVDDILADAGCLLERYVGHEPEVGERIRKILANARLIKQSIVDVGADLGPPPVPSAVRVPEPPALQGVRVLVADSDDKVRRHAHQLIGRWGGIVETARDGQEALTMARLAGYDAIVADIRLPDVGGYEIYRRLKAAQPASRVILMTGYGYDAGHTLVKAKEDGLRHVLFKPFRVDQLRDALSHLTKKDPA